MSWEEEVLLDQAVLVPVLFLLPETGFCTEGFPHAFRIIDGAGQAYFTINISSTVLALSE